MQSRPAWVSLKQNGDVLNTMNSEIHVKFMLRVYLSLKLMLDPCGILSVLNVVKSCEFTCRSCSQCSPLLSYKMDSGLSDQQKKLVSWLFQMIVSEWRDPLVWVCANTIWCLPNFFNRLKNKIHWLIHVVLIVVLHFCQSLIQPGLQSCIHLQLLFCHDSEFCLCLSVIWLLIIFE